MLIVATLVKWHFSSVVFLPKTHNPVLPQLVWLSGLSTGLQTKGLLVRFPVRAHAWVVGQVPSWEHPRGNQLMFPSLSPSFPSL